MVCKDLVFNLHALRESYREVEERVGELRRDERTNSFKEEFMKFHRLAFSRVYNTTETTVTREMNNHYKDAEMVLTVMPKGLGIRERGTWRDKNISDRLEHPSNIVYWIMKGADEIKEVTSNLHSSERISKWVDWVCSHADKLDSVLDWRNCYDDGDEDEKTNKDSREDKYHAVKVPVGQPITKADGSELVVDHVWLIQRSWAGIDFTTATLVGDSGEEIHVSLTREDDLADVYYALNFKDELLELLSRVKSLQDEYLISYKRDLVESMNSDFSILLAMEAL